MPFPVSKTQALQEHQAWEVKEVSMSPRGEAQADPGAGWTNQGGWALCW